MQNKRLHKSTFIPSSTPLSLKHCILLALFNVQHALSLSLHRIKANKQVCWNWVARYNVRYRWSVFLFTAWWCSLSMGMSFWMQLQSKFTSLMWCISLCSAAEDLRENITLIYHVKWHVFGFNSPLFSFFSSFNGSTLSVRKVRVEQHWGWQGSKILCNHIT